MNWYKQYRESLGLSRHDLYEKLGIPVRTWRAWENAYRLPPQWVNKMLEMLKEKIEKE